MDVRGRGRGEEEVTTSTVLVRLEGRGIRVLKAKSSKSLYKMDRAKLPSLEDGEGRGLVLFPDDPQRLSGDQESNFLALHTPIHVLRSHVTTNSCNLADELAHWTVAN